MGFPILAILFKDKSIFLPTVTILKFHVNSNTHIFLFGLRVFMGQEHFLCRTVFCKLMVMYIEEIKFWSGYNNSYFIKKSEIYIFLLHKIIVNKKLNLFLPYDVIRIIDTCYG